MDYVGEIMSYILSKTLEVLTNRFIFQNRVRISEFVDIFTDNLYKIIPRDWIKPVHDFLDALVDEIIWT
ncbi:MAG: hypothetical protein ACTSRG_02250 [Candidatus Helarchaeota archaeon]